jgi:uncharacterized protein YlxP (DUF503 family)
MTIGVCRLELYLPSCGSLKQKRSVLKSLTARIQNKFNVSVSEINDNDLWQKAEIGVAIITNESRYANQVLSSVVELVQRQYDLSLIDYSVEMF